MEKNMTSRHFHALWEELRFFLWLIWIQMTKLVWWWETLLFWKRKGIILLKSSLPQNTSNPPDWALNTVWTLVQSTKCQIDYQTPWHSHRLAFLSPGELRCSSEVRTHDSSSHKKRIHSEKSRRCTCVSQHMNTIKNPLEVRTVKVH